MINDAIEKSSENIIETVTKTVTENVVGRLTSEITKVRRMLEEDAFAESARLTRVEKRPQKTNGLVVQHLKTHKS